MSHILGRLKHSTRLLSTLLVTCLLAVLAAAPAHAESETITAVGSGTWTAPAGITSIAIECWGGGGGGGTDSTSIIGGGGGGGGGAYARVNTFAVTPGSSYAYVVGAGGSADSAGEVSSFNGTTCVAAGGGAGGNSSPGAGGAGGTAAASTGDVVFSGGSGSIGQVISGGGGGGSAGSASDGASAASTITGATAVTGGGPGGNGGSNAAGFAPAAGPGGGGGGGEYIGSGSGGIRSGGAGYAGQIRITYQAKPTLTVTNTPATYSGAPQAANLSAKVNATPVAGTFADVKYNGSSDVPTAAGTYAVTADFTPDDPLGYNSLDDAPAGDFVIAKAPTTTTVTCGAGPFTYTGAAITPCTASVTGAGGLNQTPAVVYTGNTNAGTATADFTPDDPLGYNSLNDAPAGDFVIAKAPTTTTVTCGAGPFTYTGAAITPCTASVTGAGGLNQTPAVVYAGNTNAGTATASFSFAENANYLASSDSKNFTIAKAPTTTTVTCGAGPFTFTGAAITPCTASVTGAGGLNLVLAVVYTGNTNAGTATASASYAGSTNYLASSGSKNFTIGQATPKLSVTNSPAAYDGTPKAAAVKGSVAGAVTNVKYNGSATVPASAGTYAVTADFAPSDATNYKTLTAAAAGSFAIVKAGAPILAVDNPTVPYNGAPQAASLSASANSTPVTGTFSNVKYNDSSTVPTDAGTYIITADFTPDDTTNYDSVSGVSAGSFTIEKASTTTAVTCSAGPFTYKGTAFTPCTANATGAGGLNETLTVIYADNTNAGTATASASFAENANYLASSDSETFTIAQATPQLSVTNSPVAYSGAARAAVVVGSVAGTVTNVKYNGSGTVPANSGTYAITADFTPDDATNYKTLTGASAGSFVIEKAGTPVLTVNNAAVTYNGAPQAAVMAGSVPGTFSNIKYNGAAAVPTDAGTYNVTADFTPDDTTNYDSVSGVPVGSFTIAKAPTTTTIICSAGPFIFNGEAIEPCTARVTGPGGLNEALVVVYVDNAKVGTATASASYAGSANYLASSDSEVFVIGTAPEIFLHLPFAAK
ncbi:MAG: MBG domain-containing protein [Caldilineaceae bacterium]